MIPGQDDAMPKQADAAAGDLMGAMKGAGALAPLEALVKEEGLDCTAEDLLKYAQDIPELHGKAPQEIAAALKESPELLDEVVAAKDAAASADETEMPSYEDIQKKKMDEPETPEED